MAHWLLKTEPETFGWEHQVARGKKGEPWSGVRNFQAANNLKAMKVGDRAFFYHSNEGLAVVGIVEIVKAAYPDPSDKSGKFIQTFGHLGSGDGEFKGPHVLAFDSQGRLFVADRSNSRVDIFDQKGKFIAAWKQFGRPSGVMQERAASPSMCTVHAPHCPRPQPNFGPFSSRSLRRT